MNRPAMAGAFLVARLEHRRRKAAGTLNWRAVQDLWEDLLVIRMARRSHS